jgi:hypothetical protein
MSGKVIPVVMPDTDPGPVDLTVEDPQEPSTDITLILKRLETKIDAIGTGQQWIMSTVNNAIQGLMAGPMGAMIKNKMGKTNG